MTAPVGALREWQRQIAAGERSESTRDALSEAASWEATTQEAGAAAVAVHPGGIRRKPNVGATVRELVTVEATDVVERPVGWLWYHHIVRDALNLVEGQPEAGKTGVWLDLLARASRGESFPDGAPCEPQRILVLGSEDALESVVRPRLRTADAELERVRFVVGARSRGCTVSDRVILPNDVELLADECADRDLLYVDGSINDLVERGVRTGDDFAIRQLLDGLARIAQDTNTTVVASRHNRKGGSRDPLEFGSGTVGTVAKPRSIIGVFRDPKNPERRLFARVKCNLAPAWPTLAFRFYSDAPDSPLRVEWLGKDARTAADILREIAEARAGREDDPSRARKALGEWLRGGQWKAVAALKELAATTGLSWKAFEKAKGELGVLHECRPGAGWCWRDPYSATREAP